ncbi:hypothetical protein [Micromonospora craterilacus]|nr:hypothetical protein [Micromonospora craterilacus]
MTSPQPTDEQVRDAVTDLTNALAPYRLGGGRVDEAEAGRG